MDWVSDDAVFLTVLGSLLGAGTALLGLVVGHRQRSWPTRVGHMTGGTTAELASEQDDSRWILLEPLERLELPAYKPLASAPDVLGRL